MYMFQTIQRNIRMLRYKIMDILDIPNPNTSFNNKKIITIIGTTGVGKSQLSIEIAKKYNGEIINADSMQMYKGLDNITNKHPIVERDGVVHHIMNHIDWNDQYYIHRFKNECSLTFNDIWDRGKIPILVGGTHYYLQSVLFDNKTVENDKEDVVDEVGEVDYSKLKDEERLILESEDSGLIFDKLKEVDPKISEKFHPNDKRRIKRALEIYFSTGQCASSIYEKQRKKMDDVGTSLKYNTLFFWIYSNKVELDKRLDLRVNKMMLDGGIQELIDLFEYYEKNQIEDLEVGVWQVIGFKEFLPYLKDEECLANLKRINDIEDDDERIANINELINQDDKFKVCCDEMKLRTRRYAKKQIKWIKNLLGPELKEEEKNGFVKFGKIYVLNATQLKDWEENVKLRGFSIMDNFIKNNGYVNDFIDHVPDELKEENLINNERITSLNKTENWKYYTCNVCVDKMTNNPLIYVGKQWELHLNSKKHKFNLNRGKKKREYEEWLKKNKDGNV